MLHAVIMAGGAGTRFWPASRAARPKQLLAFGLGRPLAEETLDRVSSLIPPDRILVMTSARYRGVMGEILPEVPQENFIGEPACCDTSACIGLAAVILRKRDPEAVMAVLPSDHIIRPKELFCTSLAAAEGFLKTHRSTLVTFGIEPNAPATGYGYIQTGEELFRGDGLTIFRVERFREKPDQSEATALIEEGGCYWNSGVFLWRADAILECIRDFLPELHAGLKKLAAKAGGADFEKAVAAIYPSLPKISIDFGVMEKAPDRAVAAVNYFWDDVGSWRALERFIKPDGDGNSVDGEFEGIDVSNSIVAARGGIVAAIGVEGLIIVHTPDATLVCRKDDAEAVKALVDRLAEEYR